MMILDLTDVLEINGNSYPIRILEPFLTAETDA